MEELRQFTPDEIARAFVALGGNERLQKSSHRVVEMPNGAVVVIPGGDVLVAALTEKLLATAGVTTEEVERALT